MRCDEMRSHGQRSVTGEVRAAANKPGRPQRRPAVNGQVRGAHGSCPTPPREPARPRARARPPAAAPLRKSVTTPHTRVGSATDGERLAQRTTASSRRGATRQQRSERAREERCGVEAACLRRVRVRASQSRAQLLAPLLPPDGVPRHPCSSQRSPRAWQAALVARHSMQCARAIRRGAREPSRAHTCRQAATWYGHGRALRGAGHCHHHHPRPPPPPWALIGHHHHPGP
jgi:hypothetical protein